MVIKTRSHDADEVILKALGLYANVADTMRERMIAAQNYDVLEHHLHPEQHPAQPMRWADDPLVEVSE